MKTHLLIIDPQNDFLDIPGAALPVKGAASDMVRLAGFIAATGTRLDGITVTMDSHPSVAIERTTFWKQSDSSDVAPFTFITAADVRAGKFAPRSACPAVRSQALATLDAMAAKGREGLVVWPVHCVTGTWGHNIAASVATQLATWEFEQQRAVRKVLKGEHPMTEHFGVFEADAPIADAPATQFNYELAKAVADCDTLVIAGEASSHCVASSFDQLASKLKAQARKPRVILLRDCMSPVPGFEAAEQAFIERVWAFGAEVMSAGEAAAALAEGA